MWPWYLSFISRVLFLLHLFFIMISLFSWSNTAFIGWFPFPSMSSFDFPISWKSQVQSVFSYTWVVEIKRYSTGMFIKFSIFNLNSAVSTAQESFHEPFPGQSLILFSRVIIRDSHYALRASPTWLQPYLEIELFTLFDMKLNSWCYETELNVTYKLFSFLSSICRSSIVPSLNPRYLSSFTLDLILHLDLASLVISVLSGIFAFTFVQSLNHCICAQKHGKLSHRNHAYHPSLTDTFFLPRHTIQRPLFSQPNFSKVTVAPFSNITLYNSI